MRPQYYDICHLGKLPAGDVLLVNVYGGRGSRQAGLPTAATENWFACARGDMDALIEPPRSEWLCRRPLLGAARGHAWAAKPFNVTAVFECI